jgi:beta-phosphoglucomutase family hydrolase
MNQNKFKAVIFDLDGVITQTAEVHGKAWKAMFDEFLKQYAETHNQPFKEFTHQDDYLPYVDGKPRYKGVASFLQSRNIDLPFGDPSDSPEKNTICGLGNRKNIKFNEILEKEGVSTYPATVRLIHQLRKQGVKIGVASSSKNCKNVLEAANLIHLFETRVDGVVSAELGLQGKPEADIFTTASDNLGVAYHEAIVVEDAVSGVQAGKNGRFGLVLGIAREDNHHELLKNGADIVVNDLEEISVDDLNLWFEKGLEDEKWSLRYVDYDPAKEKSRESLLAIGNGYFGTRGAMEESTASDSNYPGTYIAGTYNRLITKISGKDIENEDFVNVPNWISLTFKIDDGPWLDINQTKILNIDRKIDFRTGKLSRTMTVEDQQGRQTLISSNRMASMKQPHLGGMTYAVKPLNYSGTITFRSGLDGDIINDGVKRYRDLNQQHLSPVSRSADAATLFLTVKTTQSAILIAEAARHTVFVDGKKTETDFQADLKPEAAFLTVSLELAQNQEASIEKLVALYTSNNYETGEPETNARKAIEKAITFEELANESAQSWQKLWQEMDIRIEGDRMSQKLLRLHAYHLMVSASKHNNEIDAGVTARGLHGEAYRGHIFWDELFILPFYNLHFPETAKSLLMYRYRRLDEARKNAGNHGYEGAMFPWQSGSNGREETQIIHLNPVSGEWGDDYSSLQRHVSLAIAYNIWQYQHHTQDIDFIEKYGAEMFLDICRFWASKAEYDEKTGRYHIDKVMGPDEFHEAYPGHEEGGIRDNTYTNLMVVWAFESAFELLDNMSEAAKNKVLQKLQLSEKEMNRWRDISHKMNIVIQDDILAQYDGYFDLKELDWDAYRKKYGNIYRLDRILKAEGKSADDFKVAKQADTLMTFYNLNEDVVTQLLSQLGYQVAEDYLTKNLKYYLQRTSHGSTLSRVVHALLASMIGDKTLSWELYQDALFSDFNDIQGGTTGEGIHVGVMAGTIMIALNTFAGINSFGDSLQVNPDLPALWQEMRFGLWFKDVRYEFCIQKNQLEISAGSEISGPVTVFVGKKAYELKKDQAIVVAL